MLSQIVEPIKYVPRHAMETIIISSLLMDVLLEREGKEPPTPITNERIVHALDLLGKIEECKVYVGKRH